MPLTDPFVAESFRAAKGLSGRLFRERGDGLPDANSLLA